MNNRYKNLLKNTGILTISNFSSKILIFFLVPLYTSVLSTEEYGTYDIIISTVQILFPILTVNFTDAIMRFSMDKNADHKKIFGNVLPFVIIPTLLVTLGAILNRILGLWGVIKNLEIYIVFYYIAYEMQQILVQFAKGMERVKEIGISGVIGTLTTVLANVLFLLVFNIGLPGFFVATILGLLFPAMYLALKLKIWNYISLDIDKNLMREMLIYSFPLLFAVIGWQINSFFDKYVVVFMVGLAANGLISVAYKIPSILTTFQGIFIQAWQISAIKAYDESGSREFYNKTFILLNAMMCIVCSGLILMCRPISRLLFAKEFYQAWQYVPFLLVSAVFNASSGYVGPILSAKKDTKAMAKSAIYGSSVNIVLNILLVYLIGVQGAVIATAISSFVIYFVRKKAAADELVPDNYNVIIISWIVIIAQAACEVYIHSYMLDVGFLAVILLLYKNCLQNILEMLINKFRRPNPN